MAQSTFIYNYDHEPIKEVYEQNKAVSPYIDQYEYTWKDGNIVEVDFSTTNSLQSTDIDTIKLSYDTQVNPYFSLYFRSGIRELTYGFWAGTLHGAAKNGYIANIYSLNRNNFLIDNHKLLYNDQGLLIKRTGNEGNKNSYFFINYEYEEY